MKRLLSSVLALMLCLGAAAVHQRQFIHINSSNSDLSSDCVRALFQDSRGYIWIGTAKGVNRYDGTRIRVYGKAELGLQSDYISCIDEDMQGNVWVATSYGVSRYDFEGDSFTSLGELSPEGEKIGNPVNTIVSDSRGYMWFSVNDQGIFRYSVESGELKKFPITFRRFAINEEGRFWVTSYYKNLFVSDSSMDALSPVDLGPESDYFVGDQIQMLEFSAADPSILYVASLSKGLSIVDTRKRTVRNLCVLPRDANLISAFLENESRWWAATSNGVFCYDLTSGKLEIYNHGVDSFSISDNYAQAAIVDREGGLWIGTKDGGVDYAGPFVNRFRKVYETTAGVSLQKSIVSGFSQTDDGTVWVTTEQMGLYSYRDGLLKREAEHRLPKTLTVPVPDGRYIWLGSITGLYRLDTGDMSVKSYGPMPTYDHLMDPRVYNVTKFSSGDIYAGTTRGFSRYDRASDRFFPVSPTGRRFYTSMLEASSGHVWLSSFYDGVFKCDGGTLETVSSYTEDDGLMDNRVCSMFEDREGTIWAVGFSSGFAKIDERTGVITTINRRSHRSLDSEIFYSAVQDDSGRIWLTSGKGLVVYSPVSDALFVYHLSDGLLDEKFTRSSFKDSDGRLFFGSDNGFIVVDPKSDEFNVPGPSLPDFITFPAL